MFYRLSLSINHFIKMKRHSSLVSTLELNLYYLFKIIFCDLYKVNQLCVTESIRLLSKILMFSSQKPQVNHLTHLSHSVSVHGQKTHFHSFLSHFVSLLAHYGSIESNDSLEFFCAQTVFPGLFCLLESRRCPRGEKSDVVV